LGDIDLLVVYESADDLPTVKHVLQGIAQRIPLDIIFMHKEEEREFGFVIGQRAVKISEVWPTTNQ
jgi:hypothetical protein